MALIPVHAAVCACGFDLATVQRVEGGFAVVCDFDRGGCACTVFKVGRSVTEADAVALWNRRQAATVGAVDAGL